MAQLNTRIILRNDSTINWEAQASQILLKGEVGVEFLADGSAKLKIGDGVKSWGELDYFGGEFDTTAIDNLETKLKALEEALGQDGETPTGVFEDLAELFSKIDAHDNALIALEELKQLVGVPAKDEEVATGIFAELERLDEVEEDVTNLNTALAGKANADSVYTKEEVYTKSEVIAAIADVEHLKRKIVKDVAEAKQFITENPLTADQYIYMVPGEEEENDHYDEYMVVEGQLERVGDWTVDLSDYAKASEVANLKTQVEGISGEMADFVKGDELTEALINKVEKDELANYAKLTDIENFVTNETVNNLTTIINNKVEKVENKDLVSNDEIAKLLTVGANAQENFVKAVEETQLKVDETGKLSILAIDQALVGGLGDTLANILNNKVDKQTVENINTALGNKVDKNGTDRLITEEEAKKLEKLVLSDDGTVGISGTINASNVKELYDNVVRIVTGSDSYEFDGVAKELLGIEKGAQVNVIEKITLNGSDPLIVTDKTVDIPVATITTAGLVKSAEGVNKVAVGADGTMEVNSLNVNKLVQTEGDYIILNGGNSAAEY